jgi:hypothetical protein
LYERADGEMMNQTPTAAMPSCSAIDRRITGHTVAPPPSTRRIAPPIMFVAN